VLSQSRETSVSTDHDHRIRLDDEERILEHEPTDGQAYRIPLSMMLPSSPQVPARKHPFTATSHSSAIGKRSREEFEIDGNSDISAPEDNDTLYSFDFAEDEDQSRPSKLVKLKIDREKLRKLNDEVFYRQSDLQNTPWSATVSSDYNVSTSVVDARSSQGPPPTETLENNHPHDIINNDIEPLTHISLDMCIIPMAFTTENEPTTDLAFPTRNEPPLPSQFSSAAQRELSQHSTIDSNATCSENHSFQVPVEEMLLRRQVFGTLLSILTSADPPSAVILNLKPLVVDLMNNHKTLNINGEQNQGSSRSDAVFTCWVQMHMQLELFRSTTNYTGAAGKEWVNHCKGLSLWKDEKGPALLALNNLQIWKLNAMKEGLWIPCLDFDYELVTFFIDLTQIPGLLSEDLAEGFALYNKGLLGWFS
jgi:hypothetical protein